METKTAYICGPLTELPLDIQPLVKALYSALGDLCQQLLGTRAFVPHEHCDPIVHASLEPPEVDAIERPQVCERTSVLIVVAIDPSWGGGIEVEMANRSGVPALLLIPAGKRVSRLLRGNPAIVRTAEFSNYADALVQLKSMIKIMPTNRLSV